jgi:hypothetical protein
MSSPEERLIQTLNSLFIRKQQNFNVKEVLCDIPHAAVYQYNNNIWERSNIEGPLFVVVTSLEDKRFLAVLNKKGNYNSNNFNIIIIIL